MTDTIQAVLPAGRRDARSVAASLTNPGCTRRQILDAAGVDFDKLAVGLGGAASVKSISAVIHGNRFEHLVVDGDGTHVRRLLGTTFNIDMAGATFHDLSSRPTPDGQLSRAVRARNTRDHLDNFLHGGPPRLLRHAMVRLQVAGEWVYLEPDVLAFTADRQVVVCEIKSFPAVDGVADPRKAARAALQMAVYVLALRNIVGRLGADTNLVSGRGLLILPYNFMIHPVGFPVALDPGAIRLRRQIAQMRNPAALAAAAGLSSLPAVHDDSHDTAEALEAAIRQIPCRFSDACTSCQLHDICRDEAWQQRSVDVLGGIVQETCGAVRSVDQALALAEGTAIADGPAEAALADMLRRAASVAGRYRLGEQ